MDENVDGGLTSFAVRSCYITAICRFVTGLLDSDQNSKFKVSMYNKAKELNLPASFVELRHEATHGELPTLVVLRQAAAKSINWLWHNYWQHLQNESDFENLLLSGTGPDSIKDNLRRILKKYGYADQELQSSAGDIDLTTSGVVSKDTCVQLVRLCKDQRQNLMELVEVLLENGMPVPDSNLYVISGVSLLLQSNANLNGLDSNSDQKFQLFDPLLKMLTAHQKQFFAVFVNKLLRHLIVPSKMSTDNDTLRGFSSIWLEHIYASKEWQKMTKRDRIDDNTVVSLCLQNPSRWTVKLAKSITESPGRVRLKKLYGERISKAEDYIAPVEDESEMTSTEENEETDVGIAGWQKHRRWLEKPVGVT